MVQKVVHLVNETHALAGERGVVAPEVIQRCEQGRGEGLVLTFDQGVAGLRVFSANSAPLPTLKSETCHADEDCHDPQQTRME